MLLGKRSWGLLCLPRGSGRIRLLPGGRWGVASMAGCAGYKQGEQDRGRLGGVLGRPMTSISVQSTGGFRR